MEAFALPDVPLRKQTAIADSLDDNWPAHFGGCETVERKIGSFWVCRIGLVADVVVSGKPDFPRPHVAFRETVEKLPRINRHRATPPALPPPRRGAGRFTGQAHIAVTAR